MTDAPAPEPDRPAGFVTRTGLAILRPKWALAVASDRRHVGRSSSDVIKLILLVVLATRLHLIIEAGWTGAVIGPGYGVRLAMHVLTRALTFDLAFLVVGALVLFGAGGPRRELGRAFDFACVAVLPLLFVELLAATVVMGFGLEVPRIVGWALSGIAWSWAGALVALAIGPMRRKPTAIPAPPAEVARASRRAGWTVLALVVVGLAVQLVWTVRNVESMRPVTTGTPAPAFALPEIGPAGKDGPTHSLTDYPGKILVIDFWATWCNPCVRSLPKLDVLARGRDVAVIAINIEDDPAGARALFDEKHYAMELLVDHDSSVKRRYNVVEIPHTVIVDPQGMVRRVLRGGGHDLAAAVEEIRKQIRNQNSN